jgi:signal transduction histidine kinase
VTSVRWQTPSRPVGASPSEPGSAPLWPWLRPARAADTWLAIGVALFGVISALGARHTHEQVPGGAFAILAAMGLVLAARRRFPGTVLAAEAALVVGLAWLSTTLEGGFIAVLIASYSAAVYGSRRLSAGLVVAGILLVIGFPVVSALAGRPLSGRVHPPVTTAIAAAGALLVGWFIRRQFALRDTQVKLLAERAELAAEHKRDEARQVQLAERLRIARELHDIVAHHISVVVIQAQGAQRIADRDPARALTAMAEVERTGRTALEEMRRLLGLLRTGEPGAAESEAGESAIPGATQADAESERTSLPGPSDIGVLAERMRSAGLDVTVNTRGEPRDVPDDVGLAAYRIVQEALTNALKHAGPAHVTVGLDFTRGLRILVADDGRGAAARLSDSAVPGAGRGISGMAERAAAAGGTLLAGPRPGGGFQVNATIPLAEL